MRIKIERCIPPPPIRKQPRILPFNRLRIGESFFVKMSKNYLYYRARQYSQRNPDYKFVVRREDNGARVWRIENTKK